MGATSISGVGPGSAGPGKGPGNNRNAYVPLITPHVIAAGNVTLSGGAATVTFPTPLPGSHANYSIHLTTKATNLSSVSTTTNNSDGDFASFAIAGTSTDVVYWMVCKAGVA